MEKTLSATLRMKGCADGLISHQVQNTSGSDVREGKRSPAVGRPLITPPAQPWVQQSFYSHVYKPWGAMKHISHSCISTRWKETLSCTKLYCNVHNLNRLIQYFLFLRVVHGSQRSGGRGAPDCSSNHTSYQSDFNNVSSSPQILPVGLG